MVTGVFAIAANINAATYSTEVTMSLHEEEGSYNVDVRFMELEEKNGKLIEKLISAPRIKSTPGVPSSAYTGAASSDPDYANKENITVDVTWPYPNESGLASCVVTLKRGDKMLSRSKMQLQVNGPGRTPLILTAAEMDPKSVKVVTEKSQIYLLVEFKGKTKDDVKKLAYANFGNKVQLKDGSGQVTESGLAFGGYRDTGLALNFKTEEEAEKVARILRGNL